MNARVVVGLVAALASASLAIAPPAGARSIRFSSGYTVRHTHATWAGPDVGLTAWGVSTDFSSYTPCKSSVAGLSVDSAWNSSALHNGAELDMFFSVTRSDGRHFEVGPVYRIKKAATWPGHPAFAGQFHVGAYTPKGTYLRSGTVTSWLVNNGVSYGPVFNDTVRFRQSTKSC